MRMKHAHTILFYVSFLQSFFLNAHDYASYANNWLTAFIVDTSGKLRIPQNDYQQLCMMMISSRDRSQTTLLTQDPALKALRIVWHDWANVAHTRLNPSHERPFTVDATHRLQIMHEFWQAVDIQTAVSSEYNRLVQTIVYGTALSSQSARLALTDARTQARVFMLQALADARTQLEMLYDRVFHKTGEYDEFINQMLTNVKVSLEDYDADAIRAFSLPDFLIDYLPGLAVHTFIEADKLHNRFSQEAWQALFTLQEIGNYVWHAIETARSAYYQALIDTLTTVA